MLRLNLWSYHAYWHAATSLQLLGGNDNFFVMEDHIFFCFFFPSSLMQAEKNEGNLIILLLTFHNILCVRFHGLIAKPFKNYKLCVAKHNKPPPSPKQKSLAFEMAIFLCATNFCNVLQPKIRIWTIWSEVHSVRCVHRMEPYYNSFQRSAFNSYIKKKRCLFVEGSVFEMFSVPFSIPWL